MLKKAVQPALQRTAATLLRVCAVSKWSEIWVIDQKNRTSLSNKSGVVSSLLDKHVTLNFDESS